MNIKLKMTMFREFQKETSYPDIYKNSYATFTYVSLRSLCKSNTTIHTTIRCLYYALSDSEPTKSDVTQIKKALDVLKNDELIKCEKIGTTYAITPLMDFDILEGEKYFHVPIEYIKSVMACKGGIKLLHHYLLLCSTINVQKKFGTTDRYGFATKLDVHINPTANQRQKFGELGIIAFSEQRSKRLESGEFVNIPKLYTMPNNSDILGLAYQEQLEKEEKNIIKAKKKAKKVVYAEIDDRREQKKVQLEILEQEKIDEDIFPF